MSNVDGFSTIDVEFFTFFIFVNVYLGMDCCGSRGALMCGLF